MVVLSVACSFFDEGIGFRGMRKLDRRRRANFDFVKEGQFQKEAEVARIRVSPPDPQITSTSSVKSPCLVLEGG